MLVFDVELIGLRPTRTIPADVKAPPADAKRTASGLAYKVLKPGTGTPHPKATDMVMVHYTGWTTDGKMFDSSRDARTAGHLPAERRHQGLDRRRAVDGRRREDALLDSGERSPTRDGRGKPQGTLVFDVELLKNRQQDGGKAGSCFS